MDAAFTAEQHEIRRTLRELIAKRCGPDEVKAAVRTAAGHDEELWLTLARELGLPGLALPVEYGGVGCSVTELALACEETGRALLPSPLLATAALVAPLIAQLGTEPQRRALLPELASGALTGALVVPGAALATALGLSGAQAGGAQVGGASAAECWAGGGRAGGVQATRDGGGEGKSEDDGEFGGEGGWRLYGQAEQVLDGHRAGLLVVAAHTGGYARSRTLLFLVRATAVGVSAVRQTALDETRPQARVELRHAAAELLGSDETESVADALAATGRTAAAVLAAEAVGAADRALERTVEYVRQREQFGRAIGSFQAVKHRLADVYVAVQAARSAAYYAAWDPSAAGLALAQALEALRTAAGEAVQLHGGIGFTWEHEAHLYFKRAAGDELLFGPVHRLRAHAAEGAGVFAVGGGATEGVAV
ncbi:acyl-CoA dehydrogenase family protein [Streptomyces apocyni]|uniref:acyl-CoA dehydrogenase family protein n=1 Tax=Streptomyces apocyni TaxID=2654677 RepID=UPI0012E9BC52|nr:acyl-CoA dehydrogenase family protein [Streptomyces apocyni]